MTRTFDPFAGGEIQRTVPTTEPQREIWLSIAIGGEQASLAYNESLSAHLTGPVDADVLDVAVRLLVERHDALRATFSGDGQHLLIAATGRTALAVHDLRGGDAAAVEARRRALVDAIVRTPFDLQLGPLFRADLLLLAPERSELVLTAHHLVCDGWSIGVLLAELSGAAAAVGSKEPAAMPPAPSFADYALATRQALHGEPAARAERFWTDALAGAEAIDLPVDRPRAAALRRMPDGVAVRDLEAAREDFRIDPPLVAALQQLARQERASLAAVLLAGMAALLHRLTGQRRFAIGMPWAGQADHGQHGLVGHCVNTLPVPVDIDPDAPAREAIAAARRWLLDCGEHQRLSFGSLLARLPVPRDPSRVPLIPVVCNLDRELVPLPIGPAQVSCTTNPRAAENFELFVNATPAAGALVLETTYNSRLFERTTIQRWLAALRELLQGISAAPETPVARLPLLTAAERAFLLQTVQRSAVALPSPGGRTVPELLAARAAAAPDRVAVVDDGGACSYGALMRRADHLAHRLVAAGARAGDCIGIHTARGAGMVVAVLGIWRAGCAYVPLDPAYPAERLRLVAADAGLRIVVADAATANLVPDGGWTCIELDGGEAAAPPPCAPSPDAIAYVLHTSGSTGRPKGVAVDHRALHNHIAGIQLEPGMSAHTVLVAVITLSFDLSLFELFGPLVAGGRVVIASRATAMDGAQLLALITRHGANMLQATPSTFRLLLDAGFSGGPGFTAVNGGEALTRDLVAALLPRVGSYWNGYGPTEATVHALMARITSAEPPYPIGRPLPNYRAYVLDPLGQLAPIGVIGELHLGGPSVARGYLGQPELTAERFLPDPFAGDPGARLYRTGDFAWVGADGQFYFVGRRDGQVKVRGFRIELGELESVLATAPGVQQAAAAVHEFGPADVRLTGYYVVAAGQSADRAAIDDHLRRLLPPQLLPQHLIALAALPQTPNGKLDRKALPHPAASGERRERAAPRTALQTELAAVWTELLHADEVGIRDDFFASGGHSMLAARLMTRIWERFGVELPLRTIFQHQTIEALSGVLEAALLRDRLAGSAAGDADGDAVRSDREELLF